MAGVIDEKAKFLDRLNDEEKGEDLKKKVIPNDFFFHLRFANVNL